MEIDCRGPVDLRSIESKYELFFECALDMVFLIDITGIILDANHSAIKEYGYTRDELLSMNIRDLRAPSERDFAEGQLREAFEKGAVYETVHIRKNRSTFPVEICSRGILAENKKLLFAIVRDITERNRVQEALDKRLIALTQPPGTMDVSFTDLFDVEDIQRIQDAFAETMNVASIITYPDGTPITRPSNFRRLCIDIIRKTKKGCENCFRSDAIIGRKNPEGPIIQPCLSGGLWDAGASINVGGKHIANWLIGQVKNEAIDEQKIMLYADEIGADKNEFRKALHEVPVMTIDRFREIANFLFILARELSLKAYQNVQQARFITERKRAEEALRESEAKFKQLADSSPMPLALYDAEGNILYANKKNIATYGYTIEDTPNLKKWWPKAYPDPAYRQKVIAQWKDHVEKAVMESKEIEPMEAMVTCKDGSIRQVEFSGAAIGNLKMVIMQDITERKRTEAELSASQRFQATLISNLPGMVYRCRNDRDWTMEYVSDGCIELTGYRPADLVRNRHLSYNDLIQPDDQGHVRDEIQEALRMNRPFKITYRIRTASGQEKWVWEQGRGVPEDKPGNIALEGFITDITERKQAEDTLRESEEKLKMAERIASLGHWELDIRTNEIHWSDSNYLLLGYPVKGCNPGWESWSARIHSEDREPAVKKLKDAIQNGLPYLNEYRVVLLDGSVRYMHDVAGSTVQDSEGNPVRIFGIMQDVTEHKLAELELEKTNRALRAVSRCNEAMIHVREEPALLNAICDIIVDVGGYLMAWIGYALNDVDKTVQPMAKAGYEQRYIEKAKVTWADTERGRGPAGTAIRTKKPSVIKDVKTSPSFAPWHDLAVKMGYASVIGLPLTSNHQTFGVLTIYSNKADAFDEGEIVLLQELADDLAFGIMSIRSRIEREHSEEALRESQANLVIAQGIAQVGSYSLDTVEDRAQCSDEFYRILGLEPRDLFSYKQFLTFVHPEYREAFDRAIQEAMASGKKYNDEFRIVRLDGEVRYIHGEGNMSIDDTGRTVRMFGIIQDITDRKLAEIQLKEAKAQAELYLDLMSHDITNMNQALMGYLELIEIMGESGAIDKGLIDNSIEIINRSSRMINDVKKLTLIRTGRVTLKDLDVCEILSEVKLRYSGLPGKAVTINYTPWRDCLVRAGDLLIDVFDNLVDNAIKHSKGPVAIDLAVDRAQIDGHLYYRIAVTDTGPGIPDNLKKKLFLPLKESREKTERRGFGLYLVKTVIDFYNGQVWVDDRVPGDYTKGARFVVTLPAVEK